MKFFLSKLLEGKHLSEAEASEALQSLLSDEIPLSQKSSFLALIQTQGVRLSEIKGFLNFLREKGTKLDFSEFEAIDVCGTGGDGKNTFNISTATAFVIAGAGFKVVKHGNVSASSLCGSSDILQFLGVKFTSDESILKKSLDETNFCYLHAPLFQPALKAIAPLRKEIGFRTFFNILGPLLNPAKPKFQLIGLPEPSLLPLYRYYLEDSETHFMLVHSRDGYDEISLTGIFDTVTNQGAKTFYPKDLGFPIVSPNKLKVGKTLKSAAKTLFEIISDEDKTEKTEVVIANATFAIQLLNPQKTLAECKEIATDSIKSGKAKKVLEKVTAEK